MTKIVIKILALSFFLMILSCSNGSELSGGSNQTDNAKVQISAIYPNGDPAEGAVIKIRPVDYYSTPNTIIDQADSIDSNGSVSFNDWDSGIYIVEIRDTANQASLFKIELDSVYFDTVTLFPCGSVKGNIETDGHGGTIYALGTENQTSVDSNGDFRFSNLAEFNNYSLKFISTDNEYLSQQLDSIKVVRDSTTEISFPSQWLYNRKCIINTSSSGVYIDDTLYNFPLLITLNSNNFNFDSVNMQGEDIRFFDSDNNLLKHEIEFLNTNSKNAAIWVLVPEIQPDNSNQYISIKWGNSLAKTVDFSGQVFNSSNNFKGVWHFNNTYNDATDLNNRGTSVGSASIDSLGVIGQGLHIYSNGSYVSINNESNFDITGDLTISAWVKPDSLSKYTWNDAVLSKGTSAYTLSRATGKDVLALTTFPNGGTNTISADGFTQLNDLKLHYITGVKRNDSLYIYTDGVLEGTVYQPNDIALNDHPILIGAKDTTTVPIDVFHGLIDEVRISDTQRSENWIKLSYENQRGNSSLLIFE